MLRIPKRLQHLYPLHSSLPPTTNCIALNSHTAQGLLMFDSDLVMIVFDTLVSTTMSGELEMFKDLVVWYNLGT